jgi:FixJ family two-component response regulator
VILITGHGDVQMAVRALKAGAFDFVEKPFSDQLLLDRIHEAVEFSQHHRERRIHEAEVRACMEALTPRECEVLEQVVAGEPNKRIAYLLGLSEKTVEFHRAHVMEKMKATSLADLIKKVLTVRDDWGKP